MKTLGDRFKELRISKNWSQKKAGEVLSIEQQEISRIENNKVKQIPTELLRKIYVEFGDLNGLFGDAPTPHPQKQSDILRDPGVMSDPISAMAGWMVKMERKVALLEERLSLMEKG